MAYSEAHGAGVMGQVQSAGHGGLKEHLAGSERSLAAAAEACEASVLAIECRGLTKRYGKHRGIEDVDLTVREGEIFGFIGPNGAGKSTTIRTLLGLIGKTSGEARIFGLDIERDRKAILRQTGYLPSEVFYYDRMRARDLLAYAASFYPDRRACMQRARELAQRLELDLDARVEDMSLGNKKKVGIVAGLLHRPRLIVLDEPTSGLDPLMQRAFFGLVREENARGATVLFSSHILSEVQRVCGRVAIIREGRIVDVRDIAEMRASAVKRVSVELGDGAGAARAGEGSHADSDASASDDGFSAVRELGGVRAFESHGAQATFLFEGELSALLGLLARLPLADVAISEPTLEEAFMHYYAREREDATGAGAGAGAPASAEEAAAKASDALHLGRADARGDAR